MAWADEAEFRKELNELKRGSTRRIRLLASLALKEDALRRHYKTVSKLLCGRVRKGKGAQRYVSTERCQRGRSDARPPRPHR